MGVISTSVRDDEKQFAMKTSEGLDKDEFMITNLYNPINVINIYGEQESRVKDCDIEKRWTRIYDEIVKIDNRNEAVVIIGDLNKKIGK